MVLQPKGWGLGQREAGQGHGVWCPEHARFNVSARKTRVPQFSSWAKRLKLLGAYSLAPQILEPAEVKLPSWSVT